MNAASPDQIPASPQPNASDAQISGRNPSTAAASVAVRRNAASPAPSNTPSMAKTTPATGCSATKNHQAMRHDREHGGVGREHRREHPGQRREQRAEPDPEDQP